MKKTYLDYAATTPVKKEVVDAMIPYFTEAFGNASGLYEVAFKPKEALEKARTQVSKLINSNSDEIYFTAGGTESDNWALKGVFDANSKKGNHIITTVFEHHAILHSCEYLRKINGNVTYLSVDKEGRIDLNELKNAITDQTILISIMFANNEIGTVQDIKAIGEIAKEKGIIFHTDAVQALGNVKIDVKDMNIDLLSMSSHKIYGPKGIGALYIKKGTKISNFIHGGAQENKRRAGTENIPAIVGFGLAAELAKENFDAHVKHLSSLRDYLISEIKNNIEDVRINGSMEYRHPGNASISFEYIEGESLLLMLDFKGIAVATGSACSSKSLTPSHVLQSIGIPVEIIHGTLRFSIGDFTTKEDIDYVIKELIEIVSKLRAMSPVSKEKGW
ncbi:MAG: cysteine desulfurase NifS [Anaerovoracaceae bacterium]